MCGVDHIVYKNKPYVLEVNEVQVQVPIMKVINTKIIILIQNHQVELMVKL